MTQTRPPAVVDGEVIARLPTRPEIKLANIEDVRREMAKVYRDARYNKLDTQDASRFVYMLTQIAKMHEAHELVKRLEALEGQANERS